MQDLKKGKRKITNKQSLPVSIEQDFSNDEVMACEVTRSCKPKQNQCNDDCECNKPCKNDCDCNCNCNCGCGCNCGCNNNCEPCQEESKVCYDNLCGPACGNSISPAKFNVSNSVPYAIETNRVYDTMRFQTFTDAQSQDRCEGLQYNIEVVDVHGPVPRGTGVEVTIEKVCINYDSIEIDPGEVKLEDYDISPISDCCPSNNNCQTDFEYAVCGDRDSKCCSQGKGKSVVYKQKCLDVIVEGLVLELYGKCGCTEFKAIATPVCSCVVFNFNTLAAPIVLPASGKSATLRQNYQTSLTVDCIGKCLLYCDCCSCGCGDSDSYYELSIPNGIDLILCLQETVSVLISEQIVVLGSPNKIDPRVVDTFSKVCDFSDCEPAKSSNQGTCGCNKC